VTKQTFLHVVRTFELFSQFKSTRHGSRIATCVLSIFYIVNLNDIRLVIKYILTANIVQHLLLLFVMLGDDGAAATEKETYVS